MPPPPGARKVTQQGSTFYVIGDERHPIRDAYHTFLRAPWWVSLALIAAGFFLANLVFATVYVAVGGVGGSEHESFFDMLSFSVQTMGTVGYGVMHPDSHAANIVMIVESMVGIIVTALATGLVFAKFSRPTTRVAFSRTAVITQFEGKRTLIFRVGNRRSNVIVEAQLHVVAMLTRKTAEGETFYKAHDLTLVRDRQVGMTRGWTVMHVIDEASPLFAIDNADALKAAELEIYIALTGIDDVSMQAVHTMHQYADGDVRCGQRFVDTLQPLEDGTFLLDLRNFHETVPDHMPRA
jgi:inward rectifier potassium channel